MILEDNVIADYGYDMDVDGSKQGRKLNRASLNLKALQCAEEDCDYALTVSGNTIVGVGRPPIVLGAQEAAFDTLEEIPSTFDIDNDCYVFKRDNTYRCRYAHGGVLMENNDVVAIGETFISTFHGLFSKQTLSGDMDIIDNRFILDASTPGTVDSCSIEYLLNTPVHWKTTRCIPMEQVRLGEDVDATAGMRW